MPKISFLLSSRRYHGEMQHFICTSTTATAITTTTSKAAVVAPACSVCSWCEKQQQQQPYFDFSSHLLL